MYGFAPSIYHTVPSFDEKNAVDFRPLLYQSPGLVGEWTKFDHLIIYSYNPDASVHYQSRITNTSGTPYIILISATRTGYFT